MRAAQWHELSSEAQAIWDQLHNLMCDHHTFKTVTKTRKQLPVSVSLLLFGLEILSLVSAEARWAQREFT